LASQAISYPCTAGRSGESDVRMTDCFALVDPHRRRLQPDKGRRNKEIRKKKKRTFSEFDSTPEIIP
jgi:hypothetical protein